MTMSATQNEPVLIGVIGGSGLYNLDNLQVLYEVNPETPWGFPSSPITVSSLPSGVKIAFLSRHGIGHTITPSSVPARANIAAFKSLGVKAIIAFSAVGSLREDIPPGTFCLPDQIIDRTKGIRPSSFFGEGSSVVAHAMFGDPFSNKLVHWLESRVRKAVEEKNVEVEEEGNKRKLVTEKCIVCMEGPQFSTRAESRMYRAWGGDLINMSVLPEAKLAREAEIAYALIATATDYDSWRENSDAVTAADVFKTLQTNAALAKHVAVTVFGDLALDEAKDIIRCEEGSMKFGIMPRSDRWKEEDVEKLKWILPEYF